MVQGGKNVVELVSRGANKGAAVEALMATEPFAGARPVFIGDDLTDEAGFEACLALGGTAIIVGDRTPTAAAYRLPDVTTVHDWLGL
jgi:trehalose 6-phosphate phosphatase